MPNPLKEGVVGSQIVKHFEENYGKVAVNAESLGASSTPDSNSYRITFEDGTVADYEVTFDKGSGMKFHIKESKLLQTATATFPAIAVATVLGGMTIPAHDETFDLAESIGKQLEAFHAYVTSVRSGEQADAAVKELLTAFLSVKN